MCEEGVTGWGGGFEVTERPLLPPRTHVAIISGVRSVSCRTTAVLKALPLRIQ